MRTAAMHATLYCLLTVGVPGAISAQPIPAAVPSFKEVEAAWTGFWTAVMDGNLEGARKYIHSRRQHLFPGKRPLAELQEMAQQMAACRLDPIPFPLNLLDRDTARQHDLSEEEIARPLPPGLLDELIYRVHCQHGGETAGTQVGLRRDWDGVWRFSAL